ncbi:hypothetical protein FPK51_30025, partial [Acinetobacter baumannii]|nr:hypothetical protein [Acinetobacter baumannii]
MASALLAAALPAAAQQAAGAASAPSAAPSAAANPLLAAWTTPDGVPPYDRIRPEHYEPAFDQALASARTDYQ